MKHHMKCETVKTRHSKPLKKKCFKYIPITFWSRGSDIYQIQHKFLRIFISTFNRHFIVTERFSPSPSQLTQFCYNFT